MIVIESALPLKRFVALTGLKSGAQAMVLPRLSGINVSASTVPNGPRKRKAAAWRSAGRREQRSARKFRGVGTAMRWVGPWLTPA